MTDDECVRKVIVAYTKARALAATGRCLPPDIISLGPETAAAQLVGLYSQTSPA